MSENEAFDPTRVLDGWRAPVSPAAELVLGPLLGSSLDEAKRMRLRALGYAMHEVEDIELPELPPKRADASPCSAAAPRLLAHWQPSAWTAVCRRLSGPSAEVAQTPAGPLVDTHAPQWLCAVWPPQRVEAPLLGRWPECAALLTAQTPADAVLQLLPRLAEGARLWWADLDIDWALVAELVLHQGAQLRPSQAQRLRELAQAERDQGLARLHQGYEARDGVAWRRT